jgi:cell division GTPase FtsZ
MANERRILSIGLNSSNKEIKEDLGVNRQFIINENIDILTSIINMMVESISEDCMINIDLSDLKETLCTDKGIKFAYKKFNKNTDSKEMSEVLLNSIIEEGEELTNKKSILFIEVDDKETEILLKINEILLNIQESSKDNVDFIFSLNTKENLDENLNLGIIYN